LGSFGETRRLEVHPPQYGYGGRASAPSLGWQRGRGVWLKSDKSDKSDKCDKCDSSVIFCSVCHGMSGAGCGMALHPTRGWKPALQGVRMGIMGIMLWMRVSCRVWQREKGCRAPVTGRGLASHRWTIWFHPGSKYQIVRLLQAQNEQQRYFITINN
jgi:hypothetical protein